MTGDLLLVLATVIDTFTAALSYSESRIRIPPVSAVIISGISSALLTLSIMASGTISEFIPGAVCRIIGCIMLCLIGTVQLFRNGLRALLRRHSGSGKLSLKVFGIGLVISVYIDETKADTDKSKFLSVKESFALAAALSVDSLSGGIGAGFSGAEPLRVFLLSFILGLAALFLGGVMGKKLCGKKAGLSWVSGAMLIILAVLKIW